MPAYKSGKMKKGNKTKGYPQGDEMTKTHIPNTIKPKKKVNYTHTDAKGGKG
jgi:hypothetical protein